MRTYSELILIPTYEERVRYLKLDSIVGKSTFGLDRYLNQDFYKSYDWLKVRRDVIIRDNCCDLALKDRPIHDKVFVHHMNPICIEDILNVTEYLLDPEYLITVSFFTHNAIHFSEESLSLREPAKRSPGDTCLW